MTKVAIVEDDSSFKKELANLATSIQGIEVIGVFGDGEEFLSQIHRVRPDVLFLDVGLPGISGIQVAECTRRDFPYMDIVFITADEHYAHEAFRLYASDYITKPLDIERLQQTLNRIINKTVIDSKIELKCKESIEFLNQKDIHFVEALKKNTSIYAKNNTLTCLHSIKELEAKLDQDIFFRAGRSYLVNLLLIESVKEYTRTTFQLCFQGINAHAYLPKKLYSDFRLRIKCLD